MKRCPKQTVHTLGTTSYFLEAAYLICVLLALTTRSFKAGANFKHIMFRYMANLTAYNKDEKFQHVTLTKQL